MRIEICNADGTKKTIPVPEFIANNPISLKIAASKINQHSPVKFSSKDLKSMLSTIKVYKAENGGELLLVDVESADGVTVKVWI